MKFINKNTKNVIVADQAFIDSLSNSQDWVLKPDETLIIQTVGELIVAKLNLLKDYINNQKTEMENSYSDISVGSFADKRKEALAWKIDNTAITPYVDMLCTLPDGTVDATARVDLLNAILAKVVQVAQLEQYEDTTRTAIKACTTQAELDAIVIQQ